jgi:hypothetical protein
MSVESGTEAAQFLFWEHINGIFVAVVAIFLLTYFCHIEIWREKISRQEKRRQIHLNVQDMPGNIIVSPFSVSSVMAMVRKCVSETVASYTMYLQYEEMSKKRGKQSQT